jgi:hypothetical protein
MANKRQSVLWCWLKRTASIIAPVPLSVLVTVFAMHALVLNQAHAQASPGVIQATEFDLVSQNGSALARLRAGGAGGGLYLYDATGTQRVVLVAAGVLSVFDFDGVTQRFRVG